MFAQYFLFEICMLFFHFLYLHEPVLNGWGLSFETTVIPVGPLWHLTSNCNVWIFYEILSNSSVLIELCSEREEQKQLCKRNVYFHN